LVLSAQREEKGGGWRRFKELKKVQRETEKRKIVKGRGESWEQETLVGIYH